MEDGESSSPSTQQQQQRMNDSEKRSKNLDTLNRYIETQKTLLDRINSSISYFQELDEAAVDDPLGVFDHISDLSHDEPGVLEKLENLVADVFSEEGKETVASIDWGIFPGDSDISSLRDITASLRLSRCSTVFPPPEFAPQARTTPSTVKHPPHSLAPPPPYPRPKDSPLLCLVREERARIVDPVLSRHAAYLATLPPDSDDEKRSQSPALSRKKSKHDANVAAAAIRPRGPGGLFVKRSAAKSAGTLMAFPTVQTVTLPGYGEDVNLELRSKRIRRKTSRALAAEECSTSSKDRLNGNGLRRPSRSSRSSSVVSTVKKEAKLTIRIPPRPYHVSIGTGQPSATSLSTTASSSTGPSCLFADRNTHSPSPSVFTQDCGASVYAGASDNLNDECSMEDHGGNLDDEQIKEEPYSDAEFEEALTPSTQNGTNVGPNVSGTEMAWTNHKSNGRGGSYPVDDAHPGSIIPPKSGRKRKSDTFNQTWSVAEQHLLEKLLEEYPDGVRNRWAMISRAMGGQRSARQVASRVQKYFAKLKKFGLLVR